MWRPAALVMNLGAHLAIDPNRVDAFGMTSPAVFWAAFLDVELPRYITSPFRRIDIVGLRRDVRS
jgi:hypothetical protein